MKADDLPVSLARIKKQLAEKPPSAVEGLRLHFHVDVYGQAPKLDLFANFDLQRGPVPFGAPTHQDILDLITPQEFRAPPADLTTLLAWLAQQLNKKR